MKSNNLMIILLKLLVITIFAQIYITSALFRQIDWFTPVFGIILIICFLLYIQGSVEMPNSVFVFFIYFLFALISGIAFSEYRNEIIPYIVEYLENIVFLYILYYISKEDLEFCPKVLVGISFVSCIIALINNSTMHGRLVLHHEAGVNRLAFLLCMGIVSSIILLSRKRRKIEVFYFVVIIIIELYTQTIIGARKYFLVSCLSLIIWMVVCLRQVLDNRGYTYSTTLFFFIIFLVAVGIYRLLPFFYQSSVYERLSGEIDRTTSDATRLKLYRDGIKILVDYPLFGMGYNSFYLYSGVTSHSTYTELWAGTGIIGTVIYFAPSIMIIKDHIRMFESHLDQKVEIKANLIILVALLILGAGIALQYESLFYFVLAYLVSFSEQRVSDDTHQNNVKGCKYVKYS